MDAKTWSVIAAEHAVHSLAVAQLVKEDDVPRAFEMVADEIYDRLTLDNPSQPVISEAEHDAAALAREIERTLQSFIFVSRLSTHFPVSKPGFWQRCRLLTPNWRHVQPQQIFVDGIVACCKWTSWKVFTEARETGLTIWSGYGFYYGQWASHTWCMLGEKFVESGAPFRIYFGAQLDESETKALGKESAEFMETGGKRVRSIWTVVNGKRDVARYDEASHGHSIGRERDLKTGAVKEGLGR